MADATTASMGGARRSLGPLLPAGAFYVVFFAVPMLCLFVISFWTAKGFTLIPGFTFANYVKIFTKPKAEEDTFQKMADAIARGVKEGLQK